MVRRRHTARAGWAVALLLFGLSGAAAQPLDVFQPVLLAVTGTTLVQTGTPPVRQAPGVRRPAYPAFAWDVCLPPSVLFAYIPSVAGRLLARPADAADLPARRTAGGWRSRRSRARLVQSAAQLEAGAGAWGPRHAAGYRCTPEAAAQAAAVCAQLPPGGNLTATAASFAARARGASFAAGDGAAWRAARTARPCRRVHVLWPCVPHSGRCACEYPHHAARAGSGLPLTQANTKQGDPFRSKP